MVLTAQAEKKVYENAEVVDLDNNVAVKGSVRVVEFCPCKWNASLLAVGTSSEVTVFCLKLPEENLSTEEASVEIVKTFNHPSAITSLSWSPNMSLVIQPVWMRFVTAATDNKIRIFFSDLKDETTMKELEGHGDYINAVAVEPRQGTLVASVSDDNSCRLWGIEEGEHQQVLTLRSPGMSVCWHPEEPGKLMVGEKRGTVRMYNAASGQPLMSLETLVAPLLSADWLVTNSTLVGAAAGNSCFLWDSARTSRPFTQKAVHTSSAMEFRFSRTTNSAVCATRGSHGKQVKAINLKTNQVLFTKTGIVGRGISWHCKFPILAIGGDCKVHLYRINAT
ncbi:nucleoporin Nup37-like [Ornithodoros turicata]